MLYEMVVGHTPWMLDENQEPVCHTHTTHIPHTYHTPTGLNP